MNSCTALNFKLQDYSVCESGQNLIKLQTFSHNYETQLPREENVIIYG
jgi:hypothetical protein